MPVSVCIDAVARARRAAVDHTGLDCRLACRRVLQVVRCAPRRQTGLGQGLLLFCTSFSYFNYFSSYTIILYYLYLLIAFPPFNTQKCLPIT